MRNKGERKTNCGKKKFVEISNITYWIKNFVLSPN